MHAFSVLQLAQKAELPCDSASEGVVLSCQKQKQSNGDLIRFLSKQADARSTTIGGRLSAAQHARHVSRINLHKLY
jgi:hypothetical protein